MAEVLPFDRGNETILQPGAAAFEIDRSEADSSEGYVFAYGFEAEGGPLEAMLAASANQKYTSDIKALDDC